MQSRDDSSFWSGNKQARERCWIWHKKISDSGILEVLGRDRNGVGIQLKPDHSIANTAREIRVVISRLGLFIDQSLLSQISKCQLAY